MKNLQRLAWVTVLVCLTPVPAHAQGGWWDWLDKLSGPGPFNNGWVLEMRLFCQVEDESTVRESRELNALGEQAVWTAVSFSKGTNGRKCLTKATSNGRNLVRSYFEVRGGRITTERQALFSDAPDELIGTLAAQSVTGMLMRQLDPALAVGVGAGVLWFSGDTVQGHPARFALTPISVVFSPLKLLPRINAQKAGFISVRMEAVALVGGLKATDFNSSSSSSFQTQGDLLASVSVTFDFLTLWND